MTLLDLLSALRTDPALALGLRVALRGQPPILNVAVWIPDVGASGLLAGWRCVTLGGLWLGDVWAGSYWHVQATMRLPCSSPEDGIALCSEALTAAGWVVHRPEAATPPGPR